MTGRRRLSYPQTQALTALGEHRAKMLGHKAEFEARKAAEYAAEFNELEDQEAQLVAALLDLDTPKIRIAEVMGTKNYGNLAVLHSRASAYRKYVDEVPVVQEPEIDADMLDAQAKAFLYRLRQDVQHIDSSDDNEYGEYREDWGIPNVGVLTFLCWEEDGETKATLEALEGIDDPNLRAHLFADYAEDIMKIVYRKENT